MIIKVYFRENNKNTLIGTVSSMSQANKIMTDKMKEMNFKSYYTRVSFETDTRAWIDYGNYTKFFVFELEDSKKTFMKLFQDMSKISELEEILNEFDNEFSAYSYSEEAVCLEEDGDNYITYIGERDQRHNTKIHEDVDSAIQDVIHRLSESDTEEEQLLEKYKENIKFI